MTEYPGQEACAPLAWCRALRGLHLKRTELAVARDLAMYARPDGSSARPGVNLLAWGTGLCPRTVIAALGALEDYGLIWCVERGQKRGATGQASNYTLTRHPGLKSLEYSYEQWRKDHGMLPRGARGQPPEPSASPAPGADPALDPWAT
jgi:hypothetical protein